MKFQSRNQSFSKTLIWLSTFTDVVEHSHVSAVIWSQIPVKVLNTAAKELLLVG